MFLTTLMRPSSVSRSKASVFAIMLVSVFWKILNLLDKHAILDPKVFVFKIKNKHYFQVISKTIFYMECSIRKTKSKENLKNKYSMPKYLNIIKI